MIIIIFYIKKLIFVSTWRASSLFDTGLDYYTGVLVVLEYHTLYLWQIEQRSQKAILLVCFLYLSQTTLLLANDYNVISLLLTIHSRQLVFQGTYTC